VVTRTLEVYGAKGPVQPSDEDVLIALIQFTHEYLASSETATLLISDHEIMRSGGDPSSVMMRMRKIHFKRADLLRRLGITHLSGKNQQLLEQRMHRLSGVDLAVRNAYFQGDGTLVTNVGLHLIESFAFTEGNRYAWFAWSPTMAQLIENGELRALDTDFYFKIQDFLARRLFRHLNIFGRPGSSVYPFAEIVKTRLGLEPSTDYVSKCKDPVERACRELVRLGFLKSYKIDGRFVNEATITLSMPDDYQPSDSFRLPFEAIIDTFRRDSDHGDSTDPAARGGLWQDESAKLHKLAGKSPKARDAAREITRAVYDRFGPSAAAIRHVLETADTLVKCGVKIHTALPETLRLVEAGELTNIGLGDEPRRIIEWWVQKRQRGERVGPGLLVTALREPERVAADAIASLVDWTPDEPAIRPDQSPEAEPIWRSLRSALENRFGSAAARDWLDPVVPVGLSGVTGETRGRSAGRRELLLWAPNVTFVGYLSGKTPMADALRLEAARLGVANVCVATEGN
jgi:hypothetical protein